VNKKIATSAILIAIIAVSISLYLQTSEKKNMEPKEPSEPTVKITSFVVDNQWTYLGGVTFDCRFNITLENRGLENVTGLILKVKVSNYTEFEVGNYFFETYENGTIKEPLRAGEVREFKGTLLSHPPCPDIKPNNVVAIVLLNNTILDERTN
jgi:hypothetical protein